MEREGEPRAVRPATVLICSREPARPAARHGPLGARRDRGARGARSSSTRAPRRTRSWRRWAPVRGCSRALPASATTGLSRARNIGLRAAAERVVVLLDDDMLVAGGLARTAAGRPARRRPAASPPAACWRRRPRGPAASVPPAALVTREEPAVYRGPQPFDVVPGANVALRRGHRARPRRLRRAAGRRHAASAPPTTTTWATGCSRRAARCGTCPAAVVFHRAWRPRRELVRLRWRYGRGQGRVLRKAPEPSRPLDPEARGGRGGAAREAGVGRPAAVAA